MLPHFSQVISSICCPADWCWLSWESGRQRGEGERDTGRDRERESGRETESGTQQERRIDGWRETETERNCADKTRTQMRQHFSLTFFFILILSLWEIFVSIYKD